MSRRRSTNPTKAISITLPMTILDDIDDNLTRLQSRSAWIAEACRGRLAEDGTVDLTTRQLMLRLASLMLVEEDHTLYTLLVDRINNSTS
jgi:metal-responsive CopG/Arc/MetJ family transcriptional regulator